MYDVSNEVEELKHPRKHLAPEKVEVIKDALEGILDRQTYIHLLERRFPLKQKNRMIYSKHMERAMEIVLQAHDGRGSYC